MTVREVAQRLRAWDAGHPLPRFSTLHHAIAPVEHTLVVAFVRMAGESRPWGIAWGHPGEGPRIASVPDGRIRDDVAELCADFAEALLNHLRVHNWTYDPLARGALRSDLRQVWLPNGQHVAMLHHLNYAYSQTKHGGANLTMLQALGRSAGWLFRETSRRGSQHLIDASAALREAYSFPAEDVRQAHLGFLLAWLTAEGDRNDRQLAAMTAEQSPVSPTLDPTIDRDVLEPLVAGRQRARRESTSTDRFDAQIAEVLRRELEHRWSLCEQAYRALAADPRRENPGVDQLVAESLDSFWWKVQAHELKLADPSGGKPFVPHPETDSHGSSAAAEYLTYAAADEQYVNLLIHDDEQLFADSIESGHAIRAKVLRVEDRGQGRTTTPVWTMSVMAETVGRLREGARLVPRGARGHSTTINQIEVSDDGILIELEWNAHKTMALPTGAGAKPASDAWLGEWVDFVPSDAAGLTAMRRKRVWDAAKGPGAWLTHSSASVTLVDTNDDGAPDEAVLDDVAQIEGVTGAEQ